MKIHRGNLGRDGAAAEAPYWALLGLLLFFVFLLVLSVVQGENRGSSTPDGGDEGSEGAGRARQPRIAGRFAPTLTLGRSQSFSTNADSDIEGNLLDSISEGGRKRPKTADQPGSATDTTASDSMFHRASSDFKTPAARRSRRSESDLLLDLEGSFSADAENTPGRLASSQSFPSLLGLAGTPATERRAVVTPGNYYDTIFQSNEYRTAVGERRQPVPPRVRQVCGTCGESGHNKSRCSAASAGSKCSLCGSVAHRAPACPVILEDGSPMDPRLQRYPGQNLSPDVTKMILHAYFRLHDEANRVRSVATANPGLRTAKLLGVSNKTVYTLLNEYSEAPPDGPLPWHRDKRYDGSTSSTRMEIQKEWQLFIQEEIERTNQSTYRITVPRLAARMREHFESNFSHKAVRKMLLLMGFWYKNIGKNKVVVQTPYILNWRAKYLFLKRQWLDKNMDKNPLVVGAVDPT